MIRALLRVPLVGMLLYVAYLNIQLYYQPAMQPVAGRPVNQDLVRQLHYLKTRLHAGAAQEMQEVYPEGFVYLNALYALSWTELAAGAPAHTALHKEALREARWAIRAIDSDEGRAPFDVDLPLPYGAYYQGWRAYTLGRYLAAQMPAQRDTAEVRRFTSLCTQLAQALDTSSTPYPESYIGASWPADGVICAAALAWHDRLQHPQYQPVLRRWLSSVDTHLDTLGLIPHRTGARSGQVLEAARGSSQSQLLNFLVEIDSVYAYQHFARYRQHFLTSRFGLPGIREAADGASGVADIDSGPVLLGVGGAASIVGRRTMQRFGDTVTASGLRNSIEAFGMPWQNDAGKRYLFGALPIADAFIAWSNSLEVNRASFTAEGRRWAFHGWSALVAGLLLLLLWLLRKPRRSSNTTRLHNKPPHACA